MRWFFLYSRQSHHVSLVESARWLATSAWTAQRDVSGQRNIPSHPWIPCETTCRRAWSSEPARHRYAGRSGRTRDGWLGRA